MNNYSILFSFFLVAKSDLIPIIFKIKAVYE